MAILQREKKTLFESPRILDFQLVSSRLRSFDGYLRDMRNRFVESLKWSTFHEDKHLRCQTWSIYVVGRGDRQQAYGVGSKGVFAMSMRDGVGGSTKTLMWSELSRG